MICATLKIFCQQESQSSISANRIKAAPGTARQRDEGCRKRRNPELDATSNDHSNREHRLTNNGLLAGDDFLCGGDCVSSAANHPRPFLKAGKIREGKDAAV